MRQGSSRAGRCRQAMKHLIPPHASRGYRAKGAAGKPQDRQCVGFAPYSCHALQGSLLPGLRNNHAFGAPETSRPCLSMGPPFLTWQGLGHSSHRFPAGIAVGDHKHRNLYRLPITLAVESRRDKTTKRRASELASAALVPAKQGMSAESARQGCHGLWLRMEAVPRFQRFLLAMPVQGCLADARCPSLCCPVPLGRCEAGLNLWVNRQAS